MVLIHLKGYPKLLDGVEMGFYLGHIKSVAKYFKYLTGDTYPIGLHKNAFMAKVL